MALPAKEHYQSRGRNTIPRTLSLDRTTDALLMRLSGGQISSFMRGLIWKEQGRREAMAELAGASEVLAELKARKTGADIPEV